MPKELFMLNKSYNWCDLITVFLLQAHTKSSHLSSSQGKPGINSTHLPWLWRWDVQVWFLMWVHWRLLTHAHHSFWGKTSSLWLDSTQALTTQFILKPSSTVQSLSMHQSLVPTPGTCQLQQPAPRLTDLAQCYFPSYFLIWKEYGTGEWLKIQQRWLVEVMSLFKCYIIA